jgi:TonB family protein
VKLPAALAAGLWLTSAVPVPTAKPAGTEAVAVPATKPAPTPGPVRSEHAELPAVTPLRIVTPGGPIAPGEVVTLKVEPPALPSERQFWEIVSGPGKLMGRDGKFKAPYIVAAGGAITVVRVARGPRDASSSATAELRIREGSFPGAESCAGSDQGHIPEPGDYVYVEELPEAITIVHAEYPPSARSRGIVGTPLVNALVCSSGRVIDGYVSWGDASTPDASLEEAAMAAAMQYVFKPALAGGKPVAVWVAIPFRFPPP